MKTVTILLTFVVLAAFAQSIGQSPVATSDKGSVSIQAKGDDVRSVLHDLFTQAKKSYVLEPGVRFVLYLSLQDVEFHEALQIVLRNAGLGVEVQNGIYYIGKPKATPAPEPKAVKSQTATFQQGDGSPKGKLPETVLNKRVTTRLSKVDIRELFANLSQQASVALEVDPSVPAYKLDAFLLNTSLKYALDQITKAAGLTYAFTDRKSILVSIAPGTGSVSVHGLPPKNE